MGRPALGYYTKDRQRVPSVSSIIKHVESDNEGLLRWAWKLGSEGVNLEEARQAAAGIGTIVHAAIEGDLKGTPVDLSKLEGDAAKQVGQCMDAWYAWKEQSGLIDVLAAEFSGVSETLRYGGTSDGILQLKKRTLIDFKTGNRLYPKDLVQVAAYGMLWNELNPDLPIESYTLLRLGKEDGAFTWKHQDALGMEPARGAFLRARELYDYERSLKKMVA